MVRRLRWLGTVAGVGVVVGGLSACGLNESTTTDDASLSQKIKSVRVDSDSGGVTVEGKDGADKVSIHREITYSDDKPAERTYRVDDGVLVLNGCGRHCSVNYTLAVPKDLPVSGETSTGAVSLSRVSTVDMRTGSGSITLNRASGTVKAETSNGKITGEALRGDGISAKTSNGGIDLKPGKQQNVRAETSNGAVQVTVPAGKYRVQARTNNGKKNMALLSLSWVLHE